VGYQARNFSAPDEENPMQVIEELVHVVNPTGRIGIVGVYFPKDPGGVDKSAKKGQFQLPLGDIFEKGLSIGDRRDAGARVSAGPPRARRRCPDARANIMVELRRRLNNTIAASRIFGRGEQSERS
jgi:hypothetical protein